MRLSPEFSEFILFCDLRDIQPSTEVIRKLLDAFAVYGLLPTTYQQFGFMVNPNVGAGATAPQTRLRMASPNNALAVDFDVTRLSIESNLELDETPGKPQEKITAITSEFLKLFPRKGTRLSLIGKGIVRDIPAAVFDRTYIKLNKPLEYYQQKPPFEWSNQCCARSEVRIGTKVERLNVITILRRVQGVIPQPIVHTFDGIEIVHEVNTHQDDNDQRFDSSSINEFIAAATTIKEALLAQSRSIINDEA